MTARGAESGIMRLMDSHLPPLIAGLLEPRRYPGEVEPVSYTHLTLPTNREV